jgi:hypothetical protein
VRIGRNRDLNASQGSATGVIRRKIEAVGTGIDLEKAAVLSGVEDDALNIDFIAGTFQEETARRASQDVEIAVSIARMIRSVCSALPRLKRE